MSTIRVFALFLTLIAAPLTAADGPLRLSPVQVEGQPLAAQALRVLEALEFLGSPLPPETAGALRAAARAGDARKIQEILDPHVLLAVELSADSGLRVARGPAEASLQQAGYTPHLLKCLNPAGLTAALRLVSPQAGAVYAGTAELSMTRMEQRQFLRDQNTSGASDRFLALDLHSDPPLARKLSGLEVEYCLALIYSSVAGRREARIGVELDPPPGGKSPPAEIPVVLEARPAVRVKLRLLDFDGRPAAARLSFKAPSGRVYPPQPKRVAPDLFFQRQIYRDDGGLVLLPPGEVLVEATRGPEYRTIARTVVIPPAPEASLELRLERWINPMEWGYYGGDHHIHAAGCAHYTSPTEGVRPEDMLLQVKGEGLNVGCLLTWGPCFEYQRGFFSPAADRRSDPLTIIKYDLEVSGFGSQALGHVCLLNLRDQVYPGSEGTKTRGWPTWTTPVMRWAKAQGGYTGYAHSASGLAIDPPAAARRLREKLDADRDARLSAAEAANGLLPEGFAAVDSDRDGYLAEAELVESHRRAAEELPNLAIPEMNGVGAMEIPVSAALGACDFISAMNTARIQEWNTWYHLLDCGLPIKVSGETDFPCMSGTRVGQGRVYVSLGKIERLDFGQWCEGLAQGRSYVSDGFAHALHFAVEGRKPGEETLRFDAPRTVRVTAKVAFSPETPLNAAQGGVVPAGGKRLLGDTVNLHGTAPEGPDSGERFERRPRRVELVVNGRAAASAAVAPDGRVHDLEFEVRLERSSWVALRHFPQLHTNPVEVLVAGKPIRASRKSARWCIEVIDLLWRNREKAIVPEEREAARKAFEEAAAIYRRIEAEAPEES